MWQRTKGKFKHWQKLGLCKADIIQNYIDSANGDMSLIGENV